MSLLGIAPPLADEMELWIVASVLGMHRPPDRDVPADPLADFDPIRARVEAAKEGRPPPTLTTSRAQGQPVRTLTAIPEPEQRGA